MEHLILKVALGIIVFILVVNIVKFISDFFTNRKDYQEKSEIYREINKQVRPHLVSLEKKFETEKREGDKFGSFVFGLFKDKFPEKNSKFVEKEICKCCSDYAGADCKEDYCLAGSGLSCDKDKAKKKKEATTTDESKEEKA